MKTYALFALSMLLWVWGSSIAHAQEVLNPLQCGDITGGEIRRDDIVSYAIQMNAGDELHLEVVQVGDIGELTLSVRVGEERQLIAGGDYFERLSAATVIDLEVPFTDEYVIEVEGFRGSAAGYDLYVGCTVGGIPIPPGGQPPSAPVLDDFFGFAGLAAVDFSNIIAIPLTPGAPSSAAISPGSNSVFGFTFDGIAGETINLDFTRLQGNLSLGIAVVSSNRETIFISGLAATQSLTAELTLPTTGQYTIGVFQIELAAATTAETALFTIRISDTV